MSRGDLEMILVTLIWGINAILVKDALGSFLPMQFNAIRLNLASLLLIGVMAVSGKMERPSRKDWPLVILAGFLGNTVYQVMFIKGIAMSTASNTSFVLATTPATTAVMSHLFGKQRMTRRMWTGVIMAVAGVLVITLSGQGQGASGLSPATAGDLITFMGTIAWCLHTIIASDMVKRMSPLAFTTWTMVPGALLLIPFSLRELGAGNWEISALNWFELVFSGSVAIVFSYILWNKGVKESGPAKTAVYQNLTPVWTGVFAWLLLREPWPPVKFLGALVILTGVSLVRLSKPEPVEAARDSAPRSVSARHSDSAR